MAKKRPSFSTQRKITRPAPVPKGAGSARAASPADQSTGWVYRSAGSAPPPRAPRAAKRAAAPVAPPRSLPTPAPRPASRRSSRLIIGEYALLASGAGLVPIPLLDATLIAGVQLAMLSALATHYDVPFSRDLGKAVLSAAAAGLISARGGRALGSLLKSVPVIGSIAGDAIAPVLAVSTTYAIGRLFARHFEAGGTLSSFPLPAALAS